MRKIFFILFFFGILGFVSHFSPVFADHCSDEPADNSCHETTCFDTFGEEHVIGEYWQGECSSNPGYILEYFCNNELTIIETEAPSAACVPAEPPPVDSGTCTAKVEGSGNTRRVVLDQNNCTQPGFKPDVSYSLAGRGEIRNMRCRCIPETTSVCSRRGAVCAKQNGDAFCQAGGAGCESSFCYAATDTVSGRCADTTLSCPLENSDCSTDSECQKGGGLCSQLKCCFVGKGTRCVPNSTTCTAVPTPTPFKNKLIDCEPKDEKGKLVDPKFTQACKECLGDDPNKPTGIYSAFGCLPTDPAKVIGKFFGILLGIAGGVALILIIFSGYKMTAASNPEGLQGARETLTAAIVGLLFIIFSFVILEMIGVDILKIPEFGKTPLAPELVGVCQDQEYLIKNATKCQAPDVANNICNNLLADDSNGITFSARQEVLWQACIDSGIIN